ncbi:hypothetical protein NX059_005447 [Plenodomus lindquistii]|nr:hypothetical protein NX059_005447 [Plenodomus lindquistii]
MAYWREKGTRDNPVDLDPAPKVYVRPSQPSGRRQSGRARNAVPTNAVIINLDSDDGLDEAPVGSGQTRNVVPIISLDSDDDHDDDTQDSNPRVSPGQRLTAENRSRTAPGRSHPTHEFIVPNEEDETHVSQRDRWGASKVNEEHSEGRTARVVTPADLGGEEPSVVQGSTVFEKPASGTANTTQDRAVDRAPSSDPQLDTAPEDAVGRRQLSKGLRNNTPTARQPSQSLGGGSSALRRQTLTASPPPRQLGKNDLIDTQDDIHVTSPSPVSRDIAVESMNHQTASSTQHHTARVRTPIGDGTGTDQSEQATPSRLTTTSDSERPEHGPKHAPATMRTRTQDSHTQVVPTINGKQRARKTVTPRDDRPFRRRRLKRRSELSQHVAVQLQAERSDDDNTESANAKASSSRPSLDTSLRTVLTERTDGHTDPTSSAVVEATTTQPPVMPGPHNQSDLIAQHEPSLKLTIRTDDIDRARLAVRTCLGRHLHKRLEAHAYVTSSVLWRQRTCQETEMRAQHNQRSKPSRATDYNQHISPFKSMPAVQMRSESTSKGGEGNYITQEILVKSNARDSVVASTWVCPPTVYTCDAIVVPPFREYISLSTNLLSDNESKLLATPLILEETEENRQKLLEQLPIHYEMTHDTKGPLDLRNEQCRFYKQSFEGFLAEIGMTWDTILYWLFAPDQIIKDINDTEEGDREFEALLLDRPRYSEEEFQRDGQMMTISLFDRDDKKCRSFFSSLRTVVAQELRLSAIIAEAVFEECNFSLWYMARQSDLYQEYVQKKTRRAQAEARLTYRQVACRVCHQHTCLFHGERRERPDDESGSDSESSADSSQESNLYTHQGQGQDRASARELGDDSNSRSSDSDGSDGSDDPYSGMPVHWDSDTDVERVINYRAPMNSEGAEDVSKETSDTTKRRKPPEGAFRAEWWQNNYSTLRWNKRKPFYPCKHPGLSCDQAQCRCYREIITCEKSCQCSLSCNRRFPGCTCAQTSGKVCADKNKCMCIKFERECDADLCGSCGATDILDPINRYNEEILRNKCANVAIQRGIPRKTLLGQSTVHGFGLYAGENIKKDDFIGEYKGEIISLQESERRSIVYGYQQTMYLFRLNKHQDVDATHMGNKLRFINNADRKYANCSPKNLLCNQVYRIALFASTNIPAGTELFFDYNYPDELKATFKQPGQAPGSVIAVKEAVKQKTKSKHSTSHAGKSSASTTSAQAGTTTNVKIPSAKMLAGLRKAREAKALKAAAKLAEQQGTHLSTTTSLPDRTGPQRARKSVQEHPSARTHSRVSELRASRSRSSRDSPASTTHVGNTDESDTQATESADSHPNDTVQDSDDGGEEEDFIPDTQATQESTNSYDALFTSRSSAVVEESDDGETPRRGPGRPRISDGGEMAASAPVLAVRRRKKKVGGTRPGAGRPKRKREIGGDGDGG